MKLPPPKITFWALQLAGWSAFGLAMTFSRLGAFPLAYMALEKAHLAAAGLLCSLGLRAICRRMLRRRAALWRVLVVCVGASYLMSLAWTVGTNALTFAYLNPLFGYRSWSGAPLELFGGAVYNAFVLLAWCVLYVGISYHGELQCERERSLRAEALAHRARLEALRYQINPHFLFNTLNAVSTLVAEGRAAEANRMIARLSDFLRLTLQGSGATEVPLAEEIAFTRQYLEIEQVRFDDRLGVELDVSSDALPALVPALILQPLVENAIKHAVGPRERGGRIAVVARRDGDSLRLEVADDGPGAGDADPEAGRGVGLANTRGRLRELYGDAHTFTLRSPEGGGFAAVLELPLRLAPAGAPGRPAPGAAAE